MGKSTSKIYTFDLFRWLSIASLLTLFFIPATKVEEKLTPLDINTSCVKPETDSTSFPDKQMRANSKNNPGSPFRTKKANPFESVIQKAADQHRIDSALITAMIKAESGFNPNAESRKGAKGLMQLMPQTARSLGVDDCFNPEQNIHAGVGYFKKLLNRFGGDVKLALAAYNAGSRRVRQYKGLPPFKETHNYIKSVLEYYECYKDCSERECGDLFM